MYYAKKKYIRTVKTSKLIPVGFAPQIAQELRPVLNLFDIIDVESEMLPPSSLSSLFEYIVK